MGDENRSLIAYESHRVAEDKFEYYFLGLLSAVCAYSFQNIRPGHLGMTPFTLEVAGLTSLLAGLTFGMMKAALHVDGLWSNFEFLHFSENAKAYRKAMLEQKPVVLNGETCSPRDLSLKLAYADSAAIHWGKRTNKTVRAEGCLRVMRNILSAAGLFSMAFAKFFQGYIEMP